MDWQHFPHLTAVLIWIVIPTPRPYPWRLQETEEKEVRYSRGQENQRSKYAYGSHNQFLDKVVKLKNTNVNTPRIKISRNILIPFKSNQIGCLIQFHSIFQSFPGPKGTWLCVWWERRGTDIVTSCRVVLLEVTHRIPLQLETANKLQHTRCVTLLGQPHSEVTAANHRHSSGHVMITAKLWKCLNVSR